MDLDWLSSQPVAAVGRQQSVPCSPNDATSQLSRCSVACHITHRSGPSQQRVSIHHRKDVQQPKAQSTDCPRLAAWRRARTLGDIAFSAGNRSYAFISSFSRAVRASCGLHPHTQIHRKVRIMQDVPASVKALM